MNGASQWRMERPRPHGNVRRSRRVSSPLFFSSLCRGDSPLDEGGGGLASVYVCVCVCVRGEKCYVWTGAGSIKWRD